MTNNDILKACDAITRAIDDGMLYDAFSGLISLSQGKMWWELTSKIESEVEGYRLMLKYAANGTIDPERERFYAKIKERLYTMVDSIRRRVLMVDTPTAYFNALRFEGRQTDDTVRSLINKLRQLLDSSALLNKVADGKTADPVALQKEIEALEKRIFDRLWVTFPLVDDTREVVLEALMDDALADRFKRLLLSATTLGLLQYFDSKRLKLLLVAYNNVASPALAMVALTGALLGMAVHPSRRPEKSVVDLIAALRDSTPWTSDVRNVYIELRRALDTDRITRHLRNEVIPQIMKLRPDIAKKINELDGLDLESLEENPEWAEMWEKSGVGDKLREISELHEQGADVMMGAFSQLKNYPFFNDVVNWFRAFDSENSNLSNLDDSQGMLDLLDLGQGLCESDKYSLALSLASLPDAQKRMMAQQLSAQADQIAQAKLASLTTDSDDRRALVAAYVHDLYRFFRLYRRKRDFDDPFSQDLVLNDVAVIQPDVNHIDTLMVLINLGLKGKHWKSTLKLLHWLYQMQTPSSAQTLQQIGYCYEQLKDYDQAIYWYDMADLLNGSNLWTKRRLASVYRLKGDPAKALEFYQYLYTQKPDDLKLAMNVGYCLLELGQDQKAVEYFSKVDFLDEKSHKALRPLAWSLLRSCEFEKAATYYERILALNPTAEDYLNMGHLALAQSQMADALNYYNLYFDLKGKDVAALTKALKSDEETLKKIGVDTSLIPLIIDYIRYSLI